MRRRDGIFRRWSIQICATICVCMAVRMPDGAAAGIQTADVQTEDRQTIAEQSAEKQDVDVRAEDGQTADVQVGDTQVTDAESWEVTITDWTGHEIIFQEMPQRVAAVSGSLGEVWCSAGGTLVGTTQDAVTERGMDLGDEVEVVGTIKEPDLERILALNPDFVILSADISSHQKLAQTLQELEIPYGLFHEEYFEDYQKLLEQFTELTGRSDLYEKNGIQVQEKIEKILAEASKPEGKTVLLIRAFGSGFKAKNAECLAGTMLQDFGLENILDKYDSLLEDISMEEIITTDPDYIFVTTMGADVDGAIQNLENQLCADPAWASLTAIKNDRYYILPKDLFHYKPNARWAEAYAYLAELLH